MLLMSKCSTVQEFRSPPDLFLLEQNKANLTPVSLPAYNIVLLELQRMYSVISNPFEAPDQYLTFSDLMSITFVCHDDLPCYNQDIRKDDENNNLFISYYALWFITYMEFICKCSGSR